MEVARSNDGLNLLEIPEIMDHIFQFCGLQDLKACRQVSKFWKENSRKAFVSKSQVHLTFGQNRTEMSEFFKFVKFNEDHRKRPFENYILSGRLYANWQFWGLCGTFVKKLVLQDCTFVGVDAFRTIIFKSLPNIQHLVFNWCITIHPREDEWKEEGGAKPVQWEEPRFGVNRNLKTLTFLSDLKYSSMELLTHFPALEVLLLLINCNKRSWFESIEIIRQRDPDTLKLKSVRTDIHGSGASDTVLRVLADPQLSLEGLQLEVDNIDDENRIRSIIWSHADTLKELMLSRYGTLNPENIFHGPGNSELKIEKLFLCNATFSSLEFLKCMPKLKSFTCVRYEETDLLEIKDLCLPECTKVECSGFEENPKNLESFLRCFPNVQELRIWNLDNKTFSWICENCPNLVQLSIMSGTVDDCGLTGLDAEDVAAINDNGDKWKPITVRRANISSLQSLRRIYLWLGDNLDYSAVAYGFRQLPSLQNLCMEDYDVQPKAKEALRRLFPNFEIHLDEMGKVILCCCSVFGDMMDYNRRFYVNPQH